MTSDPGADRSSGTIADAPGRTERDRERLSIVESFADRVLETGRDRWSGEGTPLLADGVHVDTHEPVVWEYEGDTFVISNLASQQNLFRTLDGLSELTGDDRYATAARDAVEYHFNHLVDERGLLRWGGHQFVDLATLEPVGEFDADVHEFKCHFPYYDMLWDVDPDATRRFIRAVWEAHVLDWSRLDMNRHGKYRGDADASDREAGEDGPEAGAPWDRAFADPDPFFTGEGLSFINIGSDLIHAAGALHTLEEEPAAWEWGERLAGMYVKARHPKTGLGAYQYTKPRRRDKPPKEGPLPTTSNYGDRAENQFGAQFGDVAREGWALWGGKIRTIYVRNGLAQLRLAERLGADGARLRRWTVDGLVALAGHAYVPAENEFRPLWADGTDLTGRTFDRTGYYGERGTTWRSLPADAEFLLVYALAYRLTGDEQLWELVRAIARGLGVGDLGATPADEPTVAREGPVDTGDGAAELFAMLELYRATNESPYIQRARHVADRIVEERYHDGFFRPSADHVNARFDAVEPLALLALDAVLRGQPDTVPPYVGGSGYVHGRFDGHGRTRDTRVIWSKTRGEQAESAERDG